MLLKHIWKLEGQCVAVAQLVKLLAQYNINPAVVIKLKAGFKGKRVFKSSNILTWMTV